MKVRCKFTKGDELPVDCLAPDGNPSRNLVNPKYKLNEIEFHLEKGKVYTVYGFTIRARYIWYYIADEGYVFYPVWNPAPLFEIVDHRFSKYWIAKSEPSNLSTLLVAFPEWVNDPYFYDSLTNREEGAVETFLRYKALMDSE